MTPPDWNTYSPEPGPEMEPPRALEERTVRRRPVKPLIGAVVALGVVGVGGVALVKAVFGHEEPQTVEGFASLLEDIEDKSGSTDVFEAVIYPEYARVDLPYAAGDDRELSYRWDGSFSMEIKGTSDEVPFDLADVDASNFADMCADVSTLVDDPGTCYLIISRPDSTSQGQADRWITAFVSNDFSQNGWIAYDLEGHEVDRAEE